MQRLVVLGGGESGVGTAILGKKQGYDVFVSDFGIIKDNYRDVLNRYEIKWEDEKHTEELILNADVESRNSREIANGKKAFGKRSFSDF
jgi:UDP-N-acetylmuramoylalanine--D-glutamate ligase